MGFFEPAVLYWWSEQTTAHVYEHAERWSTVPNVRMALFQARRPRVSAWKKIIVAAYRDGLAFRLGESGPLVLRWPVQLRGYTPIPGGLWERWEEAFQRAWTLARDEAK